MTVPIEEEQRWKQRVDSISKKLEKMLATQRGKERMLRRYEKGSIFGAENAQKFQVLLKSMNASDASMEEFKDALDGYWRQLRASKDAHRRHTDLLGPFVCYTLDCDDCNDQDLKQRMDGFKHRVKEALKALAAPNIECALRMCIEHRMRDKEGIHSEQKNQVLQQRVAELEEANDALEVAVSAAARESRHSLNDISKRSELVEAALKCKVERSESALVDTQQRLAMFYRFIRQIIVCDAGTHELGALGVGETVEVMPKKELQRNLDALHDAMAGRVHALSERLRGSQQSNAELGCKLQDAQEKYFEVIAQDTLVEIERRSTDNHPKDLSDELVAARCRLNAFTRFISDAFAEGVAAMDQVELEGNLQRIASETRAKEQRLQRSMQTINALKRSNVELDEHLRLTTESQTEQKGMDEYNVCHWISLEQNQREKSPMVPMQTDHQTLQRYIAILNDKYSQKGGVSAQQWMNAMLKLGQYINGMLSMLSVPCSNPKPMDFELRSPMDRIAVILSLYALLTLYQKQLDKVTFLESETAKMGSDIKHYLQLIEDMKHRQRKTQSEKEKQIAYWQLQCEETEKKMESATESRKALSKTVSAKKQMIKQFKVKLKRTESELTKTRSLIRDQRRSTNIF